jgi:hypothetical protein
VTGYAISDYGLILIIWGISFLLFGTGLVYLLARYFRREEADVEAAEARAEVPPASAHPATADRERELTGTGRR